MKSKEEIKEWLLKNCIDEDGDLNISGLDFSDFNGNILRGSWKVKGDLFQRDNKVQGDLIQSTNKVQGDLIQSTNEVVGDLYQSYNEVVGDLYQIYNTVQGKTYNDFKKHYKVMVRDDEDNWVEDERFIKKLEDYDKEELIKMIKELKGEQNGN